MTPFNATHEAPVTIEMYGPQLGSSWEPVPLSAGITFNRAVGGTPATAILGSQLQAHNPDVVILAQGNHHPTHLRMSEALQNEFRFGVEAHPVYKSVVTPPDVAAAVAGWNSRFFGVANLPNHTFLLQQHGRTALGRAYSVASQRHNNKKRHALRGNLRWRLPDSMAIESKFKTSEYDLAANDPVSEIIEKIEAMRRDGRIRKLGLVELNFPNNPTGKQMTAGDFDRLYTYFDEVNSELHAQGLPGFIVVHDDPYSHASYLLHRDFNRASTGTDPYLNTGYPGIFQQERRTGSIFVHSKSKIGEQAGSIGEVSMTVTNPELYGLLHTKLIAKTGLSWAEQRMYRAETTYGPNFDSEWLDRCAESQQQFSDATDIVRAKLQGVEGIDLIAGEPNMVMTAMTDKSNLIGASVPCANGDMFEISDAAAVVEFMALQKGVVVVPQECDDPRYAEKTFLRFALGSPLDEIETGMDRFVAGYEEIRAHAPGPAPVN